MGALVIESGLLAYAMYVLLGLLVVSRGLARSWTGSLHAKRACDATTADIGDRVTVTLTIENAKFRELTFDDSCDALGFI